MKSQHSELFYYAMAIYGAAALAVATFPSVTTADDVALADQASRSVSANSDPTKIAGAPLMAGGAEF